MKINHLLIALTLFVSVGTLFAVSIPLDNGGFETGSIAPWGPNGGVVAHASYVKPGYVPALETYFSYMSAQGTETVGQSVPGGEPFEASKVYMFWSYAIGGGNDTGEIVYQIGYTNETGFVALATDSAVVAGTWIETAGVTYGTGATGPELGQTIAVRFGDGVDGPPGDSDVWMDVAKLDVVPEPAVLGAFALIGLVIARKRG